MSNQHNRHTVDMNHPSDELVNRTLQKMNERLAENRARPVQTPVRRIRWMQAGSLAAVAAALCVLLVSQQQAKLDPLAFSYQPDPRLSAVSKAESSAQTDLSGLRAEMDALLQPGDEQHARTSFDFYDFAMNESGPVLWLAVADYKGAHPLRLTVTNFSTTLHAALSQAEPARLNGCDVYAGQDTGTGEVFAAWQTGERFVQLQADKGTSLKAAVEWAMQLLD